MTTVLICDGQREVREGLRRSVQDVPGVDLVTTAASAEEALGGWAEQQPDLVLVALDALADGVQLTRRLVAAHPDANVVVVTGRGQAADREAVAGAIAGGARGFLSADPSFAELCAAVASALAERDLRATLPRQPVASRPAGSVALAPAPELTEREQQVLEGMAAGKSNAEIGRGLYLSEDTIKTHARRLFRKLEVNDRAQAVALGFRHGLVR